MHQGRLPSLPLGQGKIVELGPPANLRSGAAVSGGKKGGRGQSARAQAVRLVSGQALPARARAAFSPLLPAQLTGDGGVIHRLI